MDFKSDLLDVKPEDLYEIRKKYNLESDERRNEAIDMLQDWINKQEHFMRKDFSRHYLETGLVMNKGSIERTKQRIEKLCTLRTLMPEFFQDINPKDLTGLDQVLGGLLPKYDDDYYRVYLYKNLGSGFSSELYTKYFMKKIILAEYLRHHDYCNGFVIVFDNSEINMMDLLTGFNLVETKNLLTLLFDGYGMRMKGMHIIVNNSSSSIVYEVLLKLCKAVMSEKLANRIYMHRSYDELFKHVKKEIMPVDYGGTALPIQELSDKWMDAISSEEHMKLMKEVNQFKINPAMKKNIKYYEDYFGLPGSFRKLEVD